MLFSVHMLELENCFLLKAFITYPYLAKISTSFSVPTSESHSNKISLQCQILTKSSRRNCYVGYSPCKFKTCGGVCVVQAVGTRSETPSETVTQVLVIVCSWAVNSFTLLNKGSSTRFVTYNVFFSKIILREYN